jgi:septum formation protein
MKKIVLASSSPRRKEILEKTGLAFTIDADETPEDLSRALPPRELVGQIATEKAQRVAARHKNAVIIAADTIGVLGEKIIGKPHSPATAREMLRDLSGKAHLVVTGFCIIDTVTGKTAVDTVETTVYFKELSSDEIDAYVATGEPLDKAGAYAIQGRGAALVDRIEGDYYNVVGLPLNTLMEALKGFGVKVLKKEKGRSTSGLL